MNVIYYSPTHLLVIVRLNIDCLSELIAYDIFKILVRTPFSAGRVRETESDNNGVADAWDSRSDGARNKCDMPCTRRTHETVAARRVV